MKVDRVDAQSQADKQLKPGDRILEVNGRAIEGDAVVIDMGGTVTGGKVNHFGSDGINFFGTEDLFLAEADAFLVDLG